MLIEGDALQGAGVYGVDGDAKERRIMQQLYPELRRVPIEEVYAGLSFPEAPGRPYVAINMVSSVDGKTTIDGELRREPIGSRVDRRLMGWVRLHFDMVVRGGESVRVNPVYTGVPEELAALRQQRGLAAQPLAAAITRSCDLPLEGALFADAPRRTVVFTAERAPRAAREALAARADVVVAGEEEVDPEAMLRLAYEEYGVQRLLLEGGPRLNYVFLAAGCVDEIFWTVAPRLIGKAEERNLVDGPDVLRRDDRLELLSIYMFEDELYTRYRVRRPS